MKNFKFRIWHIKDKRFIPSDSSGIYLGDDGKIIEAYCGGFSAGLELRIVKDGIYIIQQFAGLQDSQGKDIYEGDILSWSEYQGWEDGRTFRGLYEVKWNEDKMRVDLYDPFEKVWWELMDTDFDAMVGNIFQNPKLLK